MTVTADCLRAALVAVQHATEQWVRTGIFPHGVLTRLKLWISGLPDDREQPAAAISEMAAKVGTNTGVVINGDALDQGAMPSLESLVLYYAKLEPTHFPIRFSEDSADETCRPQRATVFWPVAARSNLEP